MAFTYKGLQTQYLRHMVTKEEIDSQMQRLLQQNPRVTLVEDRKTLLGDEVVLDYAGFCDGEQFIGGTAENQTLVLGSGMFIPGFEEQLEGKNVGDECDVNVTFPEEYNGMGMGHVEQTIILKELSRVSPSIGKCLDVYILGLEALDLYASPEQKAKYLAPCCSGEQTVSFAFTEPETGSDPKMLKTRLVKQADGTYKLNGVKRFISNAAYDGPCVLFALEATEDGKDIVTGLVIDKFCPGYSISSPWDKIGYKGSHVYDIFMDDIVVTEDQILGKHGDGFTQLLGTTAYGKLGFTAVFVGTALGAADLALAYCQEKLHRGKSITKFHSAAPVHHADLRSHC